MKACQLKSIESLLDNHTPGNGLLNAFLNSSTRGLANLAILKTYICENVPNEMLDEAMHSFGMIAEWLRQLDIEIEDSAA